MSGADVQLSQHEALERVLSRRDNLLRTLFDVTQSYLHIKEARNLDAHHQDHDRQAFLEANDLKRNRYFDPSTLPSTRLPVHEGTAFSKSKTQALSSRDARQEQDLRTYGSQEPIANVRSDGTRLPGDPQATAVVNARTQEQKYDVRDGASANLGSINDKERERLLRAGELPIDDDIILEDDVVPEEPLGEQPGSTKLDPANKLTPPNSGRSGFEELHGASSVAPNEQHRSEVTQSVHTRMQSAGSSVDLPSRFIQDAYDDGNSIMAISPLGDDSSIKNQSTGAKGHSSPNRQVTPRIRSSIVAGMSGESSQDPTFSRRPPMRIDTGVAPLANDFGHGTDKAPAQHADISTPNKSAPLSSTAQSPRERMTTRVISGAIRHKSVSEILGETPKTSSPSERQPGENAKGELVHSHSPKSAAAVASPDAAAFRLKLHELRDKDRSKLSTVVFAKHQATTGLRPLDSYQQLEEESKPTEPRDYFLSYFATQAYQSPRAPPLYALLRQAHKTLSTSDHYIEIREKQDHRILNQIKDMQQQCKWTLRQPVRAAEPTRPVTHWDVLLGQMKWMRTDFREERKFKHAGAKYLAEACVAWVVASAEDRQALQVKIRRTTSSTHEGSASATPDLVHDEISELTEDETPVIDPTTLEPPAALFSLPPDVFVFGLNRSPVAEKILLELPCYDPAREAQDTALHLADADPDASWRTPIIPISKYAQGKLVSSEEGPPVKRSRLSYSQSFPLTTTGYQKQGDILSPADDKVALFNPENKHIRDRIHASHAFRPPSEYQMPSRDFFECRSPSQWTLAEDDELKRLVREYSYNWSLISSCLASVSIYSSGAERRTPWECFERWISLEGLPAEMSKVPYFRTYHQRLQQAARTYESRQLALLQQQGANLAQIPPRRRSNQPYTVEKRKSNKPLHLVDAMRKHAKKKEATLHKQQQQATLGAMRKNNEVPKERRQIPSAREMSRLKHEKQLKLEEQTRIARMNYQQGQARKAAQQHGNPHINGNASSRSSVPGLPNGSNPQNTSAAPALRGAGLDPARNGPQMQRLANGQGNGIVPAQGQNVSNPPLQQQMQLPMAQRGQTQMTNEMRLYQEAQRVQAEQAYLQQRQQHRHSQQNGQGLSPNLPSMNTLPPSNPALLGSMHGRSSPSINGNQSVQGSSASPRTNQPQPQSLSSGVTPTVNQIQNQVKMRNPGASPDEIQRLTTEQLVRVSQQQMSQQQSMNQQAMAAAVGNSGGAMSAIQAPGSMMHHQPAMMANGGASMYSPQQYAAYMRHQQANQQRTGSAGSGVAPGVNNSRSATPLVQRTGSAQGGGPPRGPSQSPRPGAVGVAGGQ